MKEICLSILRWVLFLCFIPFFLTGILAAIAWFMLSQGFMLASDWLGDLYDVL